jgi:hypothetical protein
MDFKLGELMRLDIILGHCFIVTRPSIMFSKLCGKLLLIAYALKIGRGLYRGNEKDIKGRYIDERGIE